MGFKTRGKGREIFGAVVTCDGKLFHFYRRADAIGNALSAKDIDDAKCNRCMASTSALMSDPDRTPVSRSQL